jgi:sporulation protein YlmC with PRC-barrel domain
LGANEQNPTKVVVSAVLRCYIDDREGEELMRIKPEAPDCGHYSDEDLKIMSKGNVRLHQQSQIQAAVERGMVVLSSTGDELGRVAAVAIHKKKGRGVYLILGHLPDEPRYQCLPVSWIERVEEETVVLNVGKEVVLALPDWHTEEG